VSQGLFEFVKIDIPGPLNRGGDAAPTVQIVVDAAPTVQIVVDAAPTVQIVVGAAPTGN